MSLLSWLASRRMRRQQEDYVRGYDWAAGVLLRGERTQEEIAHYTFDSLDTSTAFDRGVMAALRAIDALVVEELP